MGTPLPPNVPGADCSVCWGSGKPFGPGTTPKFITLEFTGFQQGSLWQDSFEQLLLGSHQLQQTGGACSWVIVETGFSWVLLYGSPFPVIRIRQITSGVVAFFNNTDPDCQLVYKNDIAGPTPFIAFGGQVHVSWNLEGL